MEIPVGQRSEPGETSKLRIIPHPKRLDEIVGTLLRSREAGEFPYDLDAARLPQDPNHMPPSLELGSKDHANFLWASCYWMRGGIKSTTAFMNLSNVYEDYPDIFDPAFAEQCSEETIEEILDANGLQFQISGIKKAWIENARRMQERYDGDPRNIFEGVTDYAELLARIKNDKRGGGFVNFQEKMVSMIAYYLMDAELVPYFDFPLPVDFHVLRISAATEIITFENIPPSGNIYSEETLAALRELYHDYSLRHGVSQLEVCNAVWALSAAICGIQPGNKMTPVSGVARSTVLQPHDADYSKTANIRAYSRSCLHCPIERKCKLNFPSAIYYRLGQMIGSERLKPPHEDPDALFSVHALASIDTAL